MSQNNQLKILGVLLLVLLMQSIHLNAGTNVRFAINASRLPEGSQIGLRGNCAPLSWFTTMKLKSSEQKGYYETTVYFEANQSQCVEFKFVIDSKPVVYESIRDNRILFLNGESQEFEAVWDVQQNFLALSIPPLNQDSLKAEFSVFEDAMRSLHPGLLRYLNQEQIDSLFENGKSQLSDIQDYSQLFLKYSQITSAIQCGHTFPSFFNQNALINQLVIRGPDKLPFSFRWIEGRMLILKSAVYPEVLTRGTEIISIDGRPVNEIMSNISRLIKSDGGNLNKKNAELNLWASGSAESFDVYFPLLYPPSEGQYKVRYTTTDQKSGEIAVAALSPTERSRLMNNEEETIQNSLWSFTLSEKNTAILKLETFDGFQLNFEWRNFLKKTFKEIRKNKINRLIIDIRGNEGGQDEVVYFLGQNLVSQPIKLVSREARTRYSKVPDRLKPYLSTWDTSYYDVTNRVESSGNGFFRLKQDSEQILKPSSKPFKGEVYLIVNGSNSSASFLLAEAVQKSKLGKVAGEPTGGSRKGLNSGIIFFLRLPYSGIEIDLPIIGTFSEQEPAGGITPDILIQEKAEDFIKGKDTIIETLKANLK